MGPGLLLLLLPWGALGNVGGGAGACGCTKRWRWEPPPEVRLPPLAPRLLRVEPCPHHVTRFVLPHARLCGPQDAPWVAELLQLYQRQVARRSMARPTARPTVRPTARPTSSPTARPTTGPPASPPASPLSPLNPPAPEDPPASPIAQRSPRAPKLDGGQQVGGQLLVLPPALLPAPAGRGAVGQDPQTPPPAVGPAPLSVGLAMGLVLLVASLGGVLGYWGGCRGPGGCRGAGRPPASPEDQIPLSRPIDVGHDPREGV